MANEVTFRNAINGFNKTDVMSYIETLLLKVSEATGAEASLHSKNEELQKNCDEARNQADKAIQEKNEAQALLDSCKAELNTLKQQKSEADKKLNDIQGQLDAARTSVISQPIEINQDSDSTINEITSSIPDVCASCDKAKLYEAQLGAAMLDAKRFSEILVKEANDKASVILKNASECALVTSKNAQVISEDIKKLTNGFNDVYSQMYKQMSGLVENLDGFIREARTNELNYHFHTEFAPETTSDKSAE